jgi:vacuolar protein sorting-associated protein 13A/C
MHLRITFVQQKVKTIQLIRVDVAITGPTIFIVLSPESNNNWPFMLDNQSNYPLTFYQVVSPENSLGGAKLSCIQDESNSQEHAGPQIRQNDLDSRACSSYAWERPSALKKRIRILIRGRYRDIDIMEMGNLPPFKFSVGNYL